MKDVIRRRLSLFVRNLCRLEKMVKSVEILVEDAFRFFQRRTGCGHFEFGVSRAEGSASNRNLYRMR